MNKKGENEEGFGETGDAFKTITMFLAATIMTLFLVSISNSAIADQLTADERVDTFLVFEAARHCFLHESEGRVYYDTVNPEKISDSRLAECIPGKNVEVILQTRAGNQLVQALNGALYAGAVSYSYQVNVLGREGIHLLNVRVVQE